MGLQYQYPVYNVVVPEVCRYNQRIAMLRAKFKREGKDPRLVAPAISVQASNSTFRFSAPSIFRPFLVVASIVYTRVELPNET
jgi:hypothetical protein